MVINFAILHGNIVEVDVFLTFNVKRSTVLTIDNTVTKTAYIKNQEPLKI